MRTILLASSLCVLALGCSKSTQGTEIPFGDACMDPSECGILECLQDPRFPGGYCTTACVDGACPIASSCSEDFGLPVCLGTCGSASDCRDDHQCWRGTCRPPCTSPTECGGTGTVCTAGTCMGVECTTSAECAVSSECVGTRCVPVASPDAGPDGGVMDGQVDMGIDINQPDIPPVGCGPCTGGVCEGDVCLPPCVDRASCGNAALVCSPVAVDDDEDGTPDRAVPVCIDSRPIEEFLGGSCGSDDDCESSTCFSGQCTEICDDDADCLLGQTCRPITRDGLSFRACWYTSPTNGVEEWTLSDTASSSGQMLPRGVIAVPPDAISLTFVLEQAEPLNMNLTFFQVFDPTGERLFDLEQLAAGTDTPVRWFPSGEATETAAMLIPNSPRVTLRSGRHVVLSGTFFDMAGPESQIAVRALVRRSVGAATGGDLRLRIYIAPGLGLNAGNAASSARLQATISRLNTVYAAAGIRAIVDGYVDVPDNRFSVIDTTQGPTSELAGLFRQSSPTTSQVVNVFLVRGISDGGGGTLGIAGGIPGPVDVHGTAHSGVVVSFDTQVVGGGGNFAGQIMAHELGHYLGLYHSTERTTDNFGGNDPIADTTRGDRANLMYFAVQNVGGGLNDNITAGQSFVLSRSATVR